MQQTITWSVTLGFIVLFSQLDASAQDTMFTYQGKLSQNGVPFTGTAEIAPMLLDAAIGGNPVATNNPPTILVNVSTGLFAASLDFGSAPFANGAPRWLQLGVRTSSGGFTTLTPSQPLTWTPYAITAGYAAKGGMATNFTGNLDGDVKGTQGATVVGVVGGQSASVVAGGAAAANGAMSANKPNTIVKRDGSGNFVAGTINATSVAATTVTASTINATTFSGNGANLTFLSASNLTGKLPLSMLSGITSNQLDAGTWKFLVALASGASTGTTAGTYGMALIPGGPFTMGETLDFTMDAVPVTNVNVSAFYMDVMPVTLPQWQGVYSYATNHGYTFVPLPLFPGKARSATHPVNTVNWYDAVKWCNARSEQSGKLPVYYEDAGLTVVFRSGEVTPTYADWTAKGYRLPTEAEWEKAARGGLVGKRFPWGNLISQTNANYEGQTTLSYDLGPNGFNPINYPLVCCTPVGSFPPNGYGLYDMAGNIFEWCWDWAGSPYPGGKDPHGVSTGTYRIFRGGAYSSNAAYCRCANRQQTWPTSRADIIGFRSVLPAGP